MCHLPSCRSKETDASLRPAADASAAGPKARFEAERLCFEIGLDPDGSILNVQAQGELNAPNVLRIARRIAAFALDTGCSRVFCDYRRTRITDSILAIYETPARMEKEGLSRTLKMAVCKAAVRSKSLNPAPIHTNYSVGRKTLPRRWCPGKPIFS